MKKIISVIVIAAITLCTACISAFAAEAAVLADFNNEDYMSFSVKGECDPNTQVVAVIYNLGYSNKDFSPETAKETVLNIEMAFSDDKGEYTVNFVMENELFEYTSGEYSITVNYKEDGVLKTKSFDSNRFVSKKDRQKITDTIENMTKDESKKEEILNTINKLFVDYGYEIMIDEKLLEVYLNDENIASAVNENIYENIEELSTIGAFKQFAEEQICLSEINCADEESIKEYLSSYRYILGLENCSYIEKYEEYEDEIYSRLAAAEDVTKKTELDDIIYETAAVIYIEKSSRWGELFGRVSKYEEIGLDMSDGSDYKKLKDSSLVFSNMLSQKPFKSFADIESKFDESVKKCLADEKDDEKKKENKKTGVGGKGISWTTPPKTENKTETNTEVKDDTNEEIVFSDVEKSHWAYEALYNLKERRILSGDEKGNINPDKNITRAEFIKLVIEAFKLKADISECEFEDVASGSWYYEYVATGYKLGIVNGTSAATFEPDKPVTRQEMAVMLCRALEKNGHKLDEASDYLFTDSNAIASYAKENINALVAKGYINGFSDGTFRPNDLSTRAQAATVLWRCVK